MKTKNFKFKSMALVLFALVLSSNVWGQSTTYTSNVTFNAGTNGSACKVKINNTDYDGMKLGTGKATGTMTFTIPKGTTKIHIHTAGWNGDGTHTLNISASNGTLGSSSISLTNDANISGSGTTFTLDGTTASTTYYFEISISNVTAQSTITLTTSAKRAIVWGVNTEAASSKTLRSIEVKTAPTTVTYTEGDNFDPTGLVITKTYSDDSTEDWAYAGHESDFSFSPTTSTALTTSNTSVTITVGGKNTTQTITVDAKPKYTVTFYNAGVVVKTVNNVTKGTLFSAIKPTIGTGSGQLNIESCDNSSTHFMGWTTEESFQKRDNAPSYVADGTAINRNLELRAVWAAEQ